MKSLHFFPPEKELEFKFIRSSGPGGQNVNKVATAVQLTFDILHSPTLTEPQRQQLLSALAAQLTHRGKLIIKATHFRTQERNKQDALERLAKLLQKAFYVPKKRKKTQPTRAAKEQRLTTKKQHAKNKQLRRISYKHFES